MATSSNSSQVNLQVTDAVTQSNVNVLGESPAQAFGTLYQIATHANGIAMQNAVSSQQNLNQMGPAIVADAVRLINEG